MRILRHCLLAALLGCALSAQALTILTEEWPPVTYAGDQGKAEGMAVEVVEALQQRLGDTTPIQVQPWARAYNTLLNEGHTLLFTVGRSAEREKLMTLLGPILVSSTDVFALSKEAPALRQLDAAALKRLPTAAYRGSIFETVARNQGYQVTPTNDSGQAARMLAAGRVKLWIDGNVVVDKVLREQGLPASSVQRVASLDKLGLYLAFAANVPRDTVLRWEAALKAIKLDGTFGTIHQRWFPQESPPLQVERLGIQK